MTATEAVAVELASFGRLTPIGRAGGQGRVHLPELVPPWLAAEPVVVKTYRRPPAMETAHVLADMVRWERALPPDPQGHLIHIAAWPTAVVSERGRVVGIVMRDQRPRFNASFLMPSGRRQDVLLALEHLLGPDRFLRARGIDLDLDTARRALVAERISGTLAFLHQHGIAASDIAPSNLLVAFRPTGPAVCFIDCDSMVFRGRQALVTVETADWDLPASFPEPRGTRASDAYKLGLVVLRLLARSHDARDPAAHLRHIPVELRDLLHRTLGPDPANRPPAGEWQRALYGLVVAGGLGARYPGPVPAPPPVSRPPVEHPRPRDERPGPRPARHLNPAAPRRAPPPQPPRTRRPLHIVVLALWVAALAVVLVVLFTRSSSPPPAAPPVTYYVPGPGGQVTPQAIP